MTLMRKMRFRKGKGCVRGPTEANSGAGVRAELSVANSELSPIIPQVGEVGVLLCLLHIIEWLVL